MNKLIFAAACLAAITSFADDKSAKNYTLQKDVTWGHPFGDGGPAFGVVQGKFGDHGHPASVFVKAKAGFDSGWHTHSEDYVGVVVEGTFSEQQANGTENKLPAGTYFSQPGKKVHRNGCVSTTDCVVFVHFDNGADSTPTTEDGKPVKK